jgi:hypothetical protein
MDWELAIDRNRKALLTIVLALMASVGLRAGGVLNGLPQFLYAKAQATLRQAESAARRLIVMAAHEEPARQPRARRCRALCLHLSSRHGRAPA